MISKEEIASVLKNALPNVDLSASDKLVTDGIIDSMSLISIISELSAAFGIRFDMSDLDSGCFESIDTISETVNRLMGNK